MTLITRLARLAVLASVVALGACKPASEAPRGSVSSADGVLRAAAPPPHSGPETTTAPAGAASEAGRQRDLLRKPGYSAAVRLGVAKAAVALQALVAAVQQVLDLEVGHLAEGIAQSARDGQ